MGKRGITLVELLVAIIVALIILGAITGLYITSHRTFSGNRDVAEMSEDVRNAITTLEFIFSRWGAGVPCPGNPANNTNNSCNINVNSIPPCDGRYPPSDPMCMDVTGSQVVFYANLYGLGFVQEADGNNATVISCRLNTERRHNCYYVWHNARIKTGYDNGGMPVAVRLDGTINQLDCMSGLNTAIIPRRVTRIGNAGNDTNLGPGDYITRVPHMVRLYLQGNTLMMERTDMGADCGDNESAVRIGTVESFRVETRGRSVVVSATFISGDGRRYPIVRYYGR